MYARNGRVRLYYETHGLPEGPPLLLLRGLTRTIRHWGSLLDDLGASFRIVVMDNRGAGRSDAPLGIYSIKTMADDAALVLAAAGVERAAVFGISLGGAVAQELCLRHPAAVSHLVLGCTRANKRDSQPPRAATVRDLLCLLWLPESRALERSTPLVLSQAFLAEHPEVLDEWKRIATIDPTRRRALIGQVGAMARHDTRDRLATIQVPTLVVSGDADRLIEVECSHRLAQRIPGARLEILRGAGHDLPAERPSQLAALLREFCGAA